MTRTNDVSDQVTEIVREAARLGYGAARIERVEEAVRLADSANDELSGYRARMGMVEAAVYGGYPEKGLVAFGWCAAKSAEDPERFPARRPGTDLLWVFKWITQQVTWYPQLERAQIESALQDMEARYVAHGLSLRPVFMQRTRAALAMGDPPERASDHYRKWQWATRDSYADCRACEFNFQTEFHVARGEHQEALRVAEPILRGDSRCAEVPHDTYALLLESALAAGRDEDAARFHTVGYPMIRDNRVFTARIANHVHYLIDVGRLDDAQAMVERHVHWATDNRVLDHQLWFHAAAARLFAKLDASVESRIAGEAKTADVLREHYRNAANRVAAQFDARNGNAHVSEQLASILAR